MRLVIHHTLVRTHVQDAHHRSEHLVFEYKTLRRIIVIMIGTYSSCMVSS